MPYPQVLYGLAQTKGLGHADFFLKQKAISLRDRECEKK